MNGRPGGAARHEWSDAAGRRVAELEAEVAALRRALAKADAAADGATHRHGAELPRERAGRADDAAAARAAALGAGARHRRDAAAGRAGLAASQAENGALRRANAELASSRAALREREERLRLILDSAADYAIIATGLDRRVTSWNAGAARLLGWSEGEIVGRSADAIFTPGDREAGAPEQEEAGALRDGRAVDERWHVRKDGSRFWASGLMMPLRDPEAGSDAPPLGLLKVMRDRTAERRAEEALREAEDHLRHTVELSPQIPWTADPQGRITGFSDRWLEVTGLSREEALGEGWARVPHPDDLPRMAAAWERSVSAGEPYDAEARLRMADGRYRRWRARAFPRRDASGRVVRWYGTTEDIHDRKAAEEALRGSEARWRGLFETMHEGFSLAEMVHGPGGEAVDYRFLEVNAAWVRQTGVPREAAVGRLISEVVRPDEAAFWIETYARVAGTGEPERVERHVPSLRRWFQATVYRTEPGRVAALVVDATERKAAEARRDALVELGDRLRDLRDPGEIAHAAAEVIGRALGASRAGYGAVDREETHRIERDWTGGPEVASVAGGWRLSEYWTGLADDLRRGEAVVVRDTARDPRSAGAADAYAAVGIRAQVVVPVVEAGRVVALLFVHHAAPRAWTEEEVAFIRGAADRAWAAAERARAEEALRESEGRRRAALDAARLGTWEWDTATGAASLDGRAREIVGLAPGWGDRVDAVFDRIHPEDRARIRAESMAAAAARGRLEAEYRVLLPGGGERAVASLGDSLPGGGGRPARMAGVFADVTERRRAEERRALLVNELNHRVKNTLAVVQSLALQTARGAADLPSFTAAFQARLIALARAHDLLTRESWEGAPLGDVARAALEGSGARVDLSACAPDAVLAPAQALALAMALHELATNALKHGALSLPGGRVSVACRTDPEDGARVVEWAERGGPPVAGPPARRGFGLRLLERGLAAQAGVAADFRFEPEGLRCTLRLPRSPSGAPAEAA